MFEVLLLGVEVKFASFRVIFHDTKRALVNFLPQVNVKQSGLHCSHANGEKNFSRFLFYEHSFLYQIYMESSLV